MRLALVLVVTACSFAPAPTSGGDDARGDAIDAPPDTPPPSTTCLGMWCRRKHVGVVGAKVNGGPHAGFPVLVALATDSELQNEARADGHDIRFTDADGVTPLPYEREAFVKANGHLSAWVRVPSLSAATGIYMYWGNASAADQQDSAATWAGFAGVWHLDETSGNLHDSTANANAAVPTNGPMLGATGAIEKAPQLDGSNDYLKINASAALSATATTGTITAWVNWTTLADGHFQYLMTSSNALGGTPDGYSWSAQPSGNFYFYPWCGDTSDYNLVNPSPFTAGAWHHAAVTLDSSTRTVKLYIDGAPITFTTTNVPALWTTVAQPQNWLWGGNPTDAQGYVAGKLDEIHVAATVRSAGWIATELANEAAPASFITVGAAEQLQP